MVLPTQTGPGASWGTGLPQHGRRATGTTTLYTEANASPKTSTRTPTAGSKPSKANQQLPDGTARGVTRAAITMSSPLKAYINLAELKAGSGVTQSFRASAFQTRL